MPKVDELLRLHTSVSLSPVSSASSLPSVYSPGSVVAPHENKTQVRNTRKRAVKPKIWQSKVEVKDGRNSLDGGLNNEDSSVRPVLVAVRCRSRKRQRAKGRFAGGIGADEEIRRSDSQDSSGSSASSSERGTNYSGTVQRGVFEYAACREYDFSANYDGKIPPPQIQRPRRLHVQGLCSGSTSGRRSFDFDFIFPPWKRQRDVYDSCVEAQIRHVLHCHRQGQVQHATIVAYGQTGTGKTFTMGMLSDFNDEEVQGLIPRALSQVLEVAGNREGGDSKTVVTLSFLQIYLETIQDLLAISGSHSIATRGKSGSKHNARRTNSDLSVRQGRDGAFYVTDLNEYEISSIQDAHALLELAVRNRVLAATAKNKTSSRSHTLLTISIKRRRRSRYSFSEEVSDRDEPDSDEELKQASTISFVDLAGSERVDGTLHFLRATRARQEQRIREAKFINRSLSALGGVIAALAQPKSGGSSSTSANVVARLQEKRPHSVENEQGQPHIRFRDSQLTKLLQGRLMSGRGRLLLIATVDDQPKNRSETLSTLKFAAQCRRVELQRGAKGRGDRNRMRRQQSLLDQVFNDMKMMHENREAALHSEYQARIGALERELEAARAAVQYPTLEDASAVHVASYTALCSLVDTVCSDNSKHPNVVDFESEKGMLDYVAGLYSRLKEALVAQHRPLSSRDAADGVTIDNRRIEPEVTSTREKERKISAPCKPIQTPTLSANNPSSRRHIPLSTEEEAEFRAVARHLIATHALDSFVVSSSDEDK